jgi:predicted restriction endonuclease
MKKKHKVRAQFRVAVYSRDNFCCKLCDCSEMLDSHHITDRSEMPNGGYVKANGITLCAEHHMMAEQFHITEGKEWIEGMHPNDLYKLIGSSYDQAVAESEKLK